jgi:hypothetical protein
VLTSQLELVLPRDRSSGAHKATACLRAATGSADSASGCLDTLESSLLAFTTPRPAYSHPAANIRKTSWLTVTWLLTQRRLTSPAQASPLWPEFCQHSSSELHLTIPHWLLHTLPVHLYALLLTPINICYRNLCDCLSVLLELTSHTIKI